MKIVITVEYSLIKIIFEKKSILKFVKAPSFNPKAKFLI